MTERPTAAPDRDGSGHYEIRLTGHLDAHWANWFDGSTVGHESEGVTVISGYVPDQAALHGLLQRVRDLGLPLVSIKRRDDVEPDQTIPEARERVTNRQGD